MNSKQLQYPLVICYIAMEDIARLVGWLKVMIDRSQKLWFSGSLR